VRAAGLFVLGILIGAWGSLCGIGGGIFAVPVFHYLYGIPLQAAVANSLVLVAVMTTGVTFFELAQPGSALRWDVVGLLVATSWIGTQLGYRVAKRMHVRTLRIVFCVLLVGVALEILLSSSARSARAGEAIEWHAGLVALVAATGLAAGFVAPLLGIGGGLVAVPALLFGLPAIGYLGARACSTAMSACNGWQSVWLYRERGGLELPTALWASAGALAGSWIGVRVAHVPGITFYAELIVALTLLLVAARFAWDLRRAAATAAP
jgi:uncharacterized membrane protein YfcA